MRHLSLIVGTVATVAAVLSTALSTFAATYTSSASFLAAIDASSYTETFDSLTANDSLAGPLSFSSNGYSYTATVTGPDNLFYNAEHGGDVWLTTNSALATITFDFTSGNVTAVGGDFFTSDFNGNFDSGDIVLGMVDGSSVTFTSTSAMDFRGFTTSADAVITSLSIHTVAPAEAVGPYYWPTVNNLIVGQAVSAAVPEPGTFALLGIGTVAGVGFLVRRRRNG